MDCDKQHCEAHFHVMELISKLEGVSDKLVEGQSDIKQSIVKLTENLLEMQRANNRFEKRCEEQDRINNQHEEKIRKNSDFVNKAIGVVGSISVLAMLGSLVLGAIQLFLR